MKRTSKAGPEGAGVHALLVRAPGSVPGITWSTEHH